MSVETYYEQRLLERNHMFIFYWSDLHLCFFGCGASEGIGPIKSSAESSLSPSCDRFVLSDMVTRLLTTKHKKITSVSKRNI
jgi:hypothetical protein